MELIIKNAIKAKRLVEAGKVSRKEIRNKSEFFLQNKDLKRGEYVSQAFKVEKSTKIGDTISPQFPIKCQICNKIGYTADNCRNKTNRVNYAQVTCQLCSVDAYSANQCRLYRTS